MFYCVPSTFFCGKSSNWSINLQINSLEFDPNNEITALVSVEKEVLTLNKKINPTAANVRTWNIHTTICIGFHTNEFIIKCCTNSAFMDLISHLSCFIFITVARFIMVVSEWHAIYKIFKSIYKLDCVLNDGLSNYLQLHHQNCQIHKI